MKNKTQERISGAIFLIFLGITLLLNSINIISLNWSGLITFFIKFWPIFIIFAGIRILFSGAKFKWIINLSLDILFNIIFFGVLILPTSYIKLTNTLNNISSKKTEVINKQVASKDNNYSKKFYIFDLNAGEFTISDSQNNAYDIKAEGTINKQFADLTIKEEIKNEKLTLKSIVKYNTGNFMWFNTKNPAKIDFRLGNSNPNGNYTPTDLQINLNAGRFVVNLEELPTQYVDIIINAGEGNFGFSDTSIPYKITTEVNAGSLTIHIPVEYHFELDHEVNAGSIELKLRNGDKRSIDGFNNVGKYCSGDCKEPNIIRIKSKVSAGTMKIIMD